MRTLPEEVQKILNGKNLEDLAIAVRYTNWRNETTLRRIIPLQAFYGKTSYHPQEQWLLRVWDLDREDYRAYSLKGIKEWVKIP